MRRPWPRRHPDDPGPTPADDAVKASAEQLAQVRKGAGPARRAERHYLEEYASRMRELRDRNHFADAIERAFGEDR